MIVLTRFRFRSRFRCPRVPCRLHRIHLFFFYIRLDPVGELRFLVRDLFGDLFFFPFFFFLLESIKPR